MVLAQQHVPGARLVEDIGREVIINLPHAAAEDGTLALFLAELDKRLAEFGIVSYGLSDTTLEEVRSLNSRRRLFHSPLLIAMLRGFFFLSHEVKFIVEKRETSVLFVVRYF